MTSSLFPSPECRPGPTQKNRPRVLVIVSGGVAEFVADTGVEVAVFDWDNYRADPVGTPIPSALFADMANDCDIPVSNS